MADAVNIVIGASYSQTIEAFAKASQSMEQFVDQTKKQMEGFRQSVEQSMGQATQGIGKLSALLPAMRVFGALKSRIEDAIGTTVLWTMDVNALAQTLGITTTETSGLSKALGGLGISTDTYRGAALNLQRSLDAQEAAFNANGIATRDAGGELIGVQQVMMNTIARLREMKPGYDANALAMRQRRRRTYAPLGRRARCVAGEAARQRMRQCGRTWARRKETPPTSPLPPLDCAPAPFHRQRWKSGTLPTTKDRENDGHYKNNDIADGCLWPGLARRRLACGQGFQGFCGFFGHLVEKQPHFHFVHWAQALVRGLQSIKIFFQHGLFFLIEFFQYGLSSLTEEQPCSHFVS
jgi:hypothetical protein